MKNTLSLVIFAANITISCGTASAQDMTFIGNPTFHFSLKWCPTEIQREGLEKHFVVTYNDCCIYHMHRKTGDKAAAKAALDPYWDLITMSRPDGGCTGGGDAEKKRRAEVLKVKLAEERIALAEAMRTMSVWDLCVSFGQLLRKARWLDVAPTLQSAALPTVQGELRRRSQRLSEARVRDSTFAIGDTQCHLYAALGSPLDTNRAVTVNGSRVQYIYGPRTYIYVERGVVTAFQD